MSKLERIKTATYRSRRFETERLQVDDHMERGKNNETRAYSLAKVLADEGRIDKAVRATQKQHKKGVDFWVYPVSRTEGFRVPIQIKSGANRAKNFRSERDPYEIAVLVVNETVSDEEVKNRIIRNMATWISKNVPPAGMAEVVNAPV